MYESKTRLSGNDVINAKSHLWIFKCNKMPNKLYISLIKFDGNIFLNRFIMKTRSYNFDHIIYQTFIKKDWGSDRGIHSFTLFCSKLDCGCTHNLFLSQKQNKTTTTKLSQFSSENFHFYSRKNPRLTVWAR